MNKFYDRNIKAYDKKADNYDNTKDGKFTEKFKSLLLNNIVLKEGDSVLDIGCGNGTLLSRMAKMKAIQGFGTDISPQMIKNATSRYPELNFAVSNCEKIPFDDGSIDLITVCAAYHHFPNVNDFAAEAKRLLKEGGSLYIAEVYMPQALRQVANIFLPFSKEGDVKFYSPKEIERTFSNDGFSLVNTVISGHIQINHFQRN